METLDAHKSLFAWLQDALSRTPIEIGLFLHSVLIPGIIRRWTSNGKIIKNEGPWIKAFLSPSLFLCCSEKRCSIFGSYRIIWLTRLKSEVSAGAGKKKRNKDIYHCSRSEKNGINKGIFMSRYKSIAFNKITWDFGNISRISSNMKKLNEQISVYFST